MKRVDPYQFVSQVRSVVGTIPSAVAEQQIVQAAIRLAKDAPILRRREEFTKWNCVEEYPLHIPENEVMHIMLNVSLDGHTIPAEANGVCHSSWYRLELPDRVHICSGFSDCKGAFVYSVLPKPDAADLDEDFFTRYFDAVVYAAASYLLNMPTQIWVNRAAADEYDRRYIREMKKTRTALVAQAQGHRIKIPYKRSV